MKRSEILHKLYAEIEMIEYTSGLDLANKILTFIETCGMLPPTITVLSDHYNRNDGTMGFEVNEWDPE